MNGDNKYNLFRNYMVNELGITREDIERWTKEAIAAQVEKLFASGRVDPNRLAVTIFTSKADAVFREIVFGGETYSNRNLLRDAIAKELVSRVELNLKK